MAQYIFLALGLMACLSLFFTLKCEILAHARKQRKRLEEMDRKVIDANERHPEAVIIPTAPRSGFNASRRVLAMRMLRRGEDVSHVAAALGVPRREVELLIRVQAIIRASVGQDSSCAPI